MASPKRPLSGETPLVFRAVFAEWQAQAGVWSALPDAPVVSDDPRPRRSARLWLRTLHARVTSQWKRGRAGQPVRPRTERAVTGTATTLGPETRPLPPSRARAGRSIAQHLDAQVPGTPEELITTVVDTER